MPPETSILPPAMPPRHFTLVVLLCGFLALSLDVVALVSPAWVTSKHFSLSLWEICNQQYDAWHCRSVWHSDPVLSFVREVGRRFMMSPGGNSSGDVKKLRSIARMKEVYGTLDRDTYWQMASLVLVFSATLICGVWFIVCVLWICKVKQPLRFRIMSLLLLSAVLLQISALLLFSLRFLAGKYLPPSSQFSWGYGLAWGSCIFMLGGVVLSCLRTGLIKE